MAEDVVEFLKPLGDDMCAPVEEGSRWMETGVFNEGSMAPSARQGDIMKLTKTVERALASPATPPSGG